MYMYIHIHTRIYIYIYIYIHIRVYLYICSYLYFFYMPLEKLIGRVDPHVIVHVYLCMYVYIYITCVSGLAHTQAYMRMRMSENIMYFSPKILHIINGHSP